jgi:hypothetical protein
MMHIIELDGRGWLAVHPLWCPGNLLECPVTQVCRNLSCAPKTGRFWCSAELKGEQYQLRLGDPCPPEIQGTSRRTGYAFTPKRTRPQ